MAITGYMESSLMTSEVFNGIESELQIKDKAVNLIKNAKHISNEDIEAAYITVKQITDSLTREALKAFDNGRIQLIYNNVPSLAMTQAMPFMTFKTKSGYITYVFVDKYIILSREGVMKMEPSVLRDLLTGALVANGIKKNYGALSSNQYLANILMDIYTKFFTRIINREFSILFDECHDQYDEYEFYVYIELINMFRTIKSSLVLFTIGDDVHAIALFRGYVEILSKIMLSDKFKEDYVAFKNYNTYLQNYKNNKEPLPADMIERLGKNATNENYIAYGWAKNKKGKSISTMTDLIKEAFGKSMDEFIHYSSEFVHEDYVNVGYNFIYLRKEYINIYYMTIKNALDEWDFDEIKTGRFENLFKNV